MDGLSRIVARVAARRATDRLTERHRTLALLLLLPGIPIALVLAVVFLALLVLVALVAGANSGGCGSSGQPVISPGPSVNNPASLTQRQGAFVKYLESQGMAANGAAGVVGNLTQESGLKTTGYVPGVGGGLAGWQPAWYAQMASYATGHGLSPTSAQGELSYIVFDLRTAYAPLLVQLNKAPDPQTAAREWETIYEKCSGVVGPMQVIPHSLCNDENRRAQAVNALRAAGGSTTALPVAAVTLGQCVLAGSGVVNTKGQTDPAPGATWSRLDMGFDGDYGPNGAVAPFSGTIHYGSISGWPGQGVYMYVINADRSGPDFTRCVYFAEGATPVVPNGTRVSAGTHIGDPVPAGGDGAPGNFEIGPCQVGNGDTLSKTYGNNSPGARAMVLRFYAWMQKLGAGPTTNTSAAGGP